MCLNSNELGNAAVILEPRNELANETVTLKPRYELADDTVTLKTREELADDTVTLKARYELAEDTVTLKARVELADETVTLKVGVPQPFIVSFGIVYNCEMSSPVDLHPFLSVTAPSVVFEWAMLTLRPSSASSRALGRDHHSEAC